MALELARAEKNPAELEMNEIAVLILRRLDHPVKPLVGRPTRYQLEYQWLDPQTRGVRGNDFSYWPPATAKEALKNGLFQTFGLVS